MTWYNFFSSYSFGVKCKQLLISRGMQETDETVNVIGSD